MLFSDAISVRQVIHRGKYRVISEWSIGKDVEGRGRGLILRHPVSCLEGLKKTMKGPSQDSQSPGQDLNPGPREYESGALTTGPRCSVVGFHCCTTMILVMHFAYVLLRRHRQTDRQTDMEGPIRCSLFTLELQEVLKWTLLTDIDINKWIFNRVEGEQWI
jgi:hypothetical protein